jgi:thiol-disulfide isomerase/thioredoxin
LSRCTVSSLSSKKEIHDGVEMLYGKVNIDQLYHDYPQWKKVEDSYIPEQVVLEQLRGIDRKCRVVVFFATWCSDSKRELPRFIKIIKDGHLDDKLSVELWAVDRNKNLSSNLSKDSNIEYVPTFIFYENDLEIGRIIETPKGSLELNMLQIMKRNRE